MGTTREQDIKDEMDTTRKAFKDGMATMEETGITDEMDITAETDTMEETGTTKGPTLLFRPL